MKRQARWAGVLGAILVGAWFLLTRPDSPTDRPASLPASPVVQEQAVPSGIAASAANTTALRCDRGATAPSSASAGPALLRASAESLAQSGDPQLKAEALYSRVMSELPRIAAAQPSLRALVELAVAERDPRIYALAYMACTPSMAGEVRPAECGRIDARAWVERDPGNLFPWLLVADEARLRGDPQSAAAALDRALHASRADDSVRPLGRLGAAIGAGHGSDQARTEAVLIATATGLRGVLTPYRALYEHCRQAKADDLALRSACQASADLMVASDGSLMLRTAGITLGERSGWSPERIKAERTLSASLGEQIGRAQLEAYEAADSCRVLGASLSQQASMAARGEVAWARDLLVRSAPAPAPVGLERGGAVPRS